MTAIFATESQTIPKSMKIALIISALFHLSVVIIGTLSLPYISKPPTMPSAIAIEVLDVSEITTTNKPPSKNRLKPAEEKPKETPKTEKLVAPPKVEAKEPPKVKPLDKPIEEKKDTKKPEPKTPPPPSEKLEKPKPPEPKKEEPKEEATTQEDDFLSLMKNLQDTEDTSEGTKQGTASSEFAPDAPLAPTMTANELNALSVQLASCWQIPIGAENVQNTVVNIHIWVNANRVVTRSEIADQWRAANDPAFRALAESARRATQDPGCNPVNIPMEKYDVWKDKYISIPFDPSYVL